MSNSPENGNGDRDPLSAQTLSEHLSALLSKLHGGQDLKTCVDQAPLACVALAAALGFITAREITSKHPASTEGSPPGLLTDLITPFLNALSQDFNELANSRLSKGTETAAAPSQKPPRQAV